eukprot:COSAG05_NODE_4110_length_1669_cov_2.664968_2_plen_22_part_01
MSNYCGPSGDWNEFEDLLSTGS